MAFKLAEAFIEFKIQGHESLWARLHAFPVTPRTAAAVEVENA